MDVMICRANGAIYLREKSLPLLLLLMVFWSAMYLGDFFSEKYGVLEHPIRIRVEQGYITEVSSENEALAKEVKEYLFSTPDGNRAGEFAIGTLTSLTKLSGNLLQDEKMPGLHVAFGNPYPEFTGADWHAKIHVDVIPTCCTIEVDGFTIMHDGKFTI